MTTTTKNLVVLGAGTAGTMVVNKLRRALPAEDWTITVVDRDDIHDYQPGYLFMAVRHEQPRAGAPPQAPLHRRRASSWCSPRSTGSTPTARVGAPRRRPRPALRPARHRHRHHAAPRPGPRHARPAVAPRGRRVLHLRGRARPARPARRVQRRTPRRAHHRDADQVPRRAPGVHLPRRRLPHQARSARPHRDRLRHPARRRVHQAGRERRRSARCSRRRASPSSRTS